MRYIYFLLFLCVLNGCVKDKIIQIINPKVIEDQTSPDVLALIPYHKSSSLVYYEWRNSIFGAFSDSSISYRTINDYDSIVCDTCFVHQRKVYDFRIKNFNLRTSAFYPNTIWYWTGYTYEDEYVEDYGAIMVENKNFKPTANQRMIDTLRLKNGLKFANVLEMKTDSTIIYYNASHGFLCYIAPLIPYNKKYLPYKDTIFQIIK